MHRLVPILLLAAAACDHGLEPPDTPQVGVIIAEIAYEGSWPADEALRDLRFVAMRFVPRDTADFLQLNRMVFSEKLAYRVAADTVVITHVETGPFLYSGVAQKYGPRPFDWRPVGIVEQNDGTFIVRPDETTNVSVTVDFADPPVFPPPNAPDTKHAR